MPESDLQPWPEDPVPADVPPDALQELADHGNRVIWGEGNPRAPLMVILDNPGAREDRSGRPFVCGTRATLRQAAEAAGLRSDDLYVTYLLKRRPTRAYDRTRAWAAYLPLLRNQSQKNAPRGLVCMGNTVVRAFIHPETDVKALLGRVIEEGGAPAIVTYHPLAARRRPHLFPLLIEDLELARTRLLSR